MSIEKIERALVKSRKSLKEVCDSLGIDLPDVEELVVSQCTQCSVWHYNYKLVEDLDGNMICKYCEDTIGL